MSICPLTPREIKVLELHSQDKTNKTIAHEIGLSVHTVNAYSKTSLAKAGVDTTTGLVAKALREGWIT